jgi:hypothetical protein
VKPPDERTPTGAVASVYVDPADGSFDVTFHADLGGVREIELRNLRLEFAADGSGLLHGISGRAEPDAGGLKVDDALKRLGGHSVVTLITSQKPGAAVTDVDLHLTDVEIDALVERWRRVHGAYDPEVSRGNCVADLLARLRAAAFGKARRVDRALVGIPLGGARRIGSSATPQSLWLPDAIAEASAVTGLIRAQRVQRKVQVQCLPVRAGCEPRLAVRPSGGSPLRFELSSDGRSASVAVPPPARNRALLLEFGVLA